MSYTFIMDFDREPDTGWHVTIHGEVSAETLSDAWERAAGSMGSALDDYASRHQESWNVAVYTEDGSAVPIQHCWDCEGAGIILGDETCPYCEGRGFSYNADEGEPEEQEDDADTE